MANWSPGQNVVVLGAGATRGAEWVSASEQPCLPPLNTDFFSQLQRIHTQKHQGLVSDVLKDVVGLYGSNFDVSLEQYFTQIDSMIEMARIVGLASHPYSGERLRNMRIRLLRAVSAVLEESADVVKQGSRAKTQPCSHHRRLVEALAPKDTIISFNYDCVIDHSLKTFGDGKWSAERGYGFTSGHIDGHEHWSAERPPTGENQSINLLKLHGSLNFFKFDPDTVNVRLKQRPYMQTGNELYEIVPPAFGKTVDGPIQSGLWKRAERALRLARTVTLIGFSFTPTDLHVDSLFRSALASNQVLERLVIANPSAHDRSRIRAVCSVALSKGKVKVVQFEDLADFAANASKQLNHP